MRSSRSGWPPARTSTTSTRALWPGWTPTSSSPRTCARCARSMSPSWTTPWLTSAVAPRWSRSTRTRWTRCSTRSACSARSRAPSHAPPSWSPVCAHDSAGWSRPSRVARRRGSLCWSGPNRRSLPGTGCRRWSSVPAACPRWEWPGAKSFRTTWEAVAASRPDLIVSAPCGFALPESTRLAGELLASGVLPDGVPLWAVDANASFARPGPRLVDGVETLAAIAHPDADGPASPSRPGVRHPTALGRSRPASTRPLNTADRLDTRGSRGRGWRRRGGRSRAPTPARTSSGRRRYAVSSWLRQPFIDRLPPPTSRWIPRIARKKRASPTLLRSAWTKNLPLT